MGEYQVILESAFSHEPHEYLRDTLDSKYRECKSCANRTEFTCTKCGFCWSCHWKMERAEKFELIDRQYQGDKPVSYVYSNMTRVDQEKGKLERQLEKTGHYLLTAKAVDVFGKESEPICDYLRCHHEFSSHGLKTSKCKCKHPQNAAIGA